MMDAEEREVQDVEPIPEEDVKPAYPETAFKMIGDDSRPFGILRHREAFVMKRVFPR